MNEPTHSDLREHDSSPPEVMIFGSGACARKIAANLADRGINAWLAARDESPPQTDNHNAMHWLDGAQLIRCRGFAGNFELQLQQKHALLHKNVPAIVLAQDATHSPNYAPYGLEPGARVITITALEEKLRQASGEALFKNGAHIVFLCGWRNDSHASIAQRMLDGCLRLQYRSGINTYFMTGNLKVAATGAEAMVQEAKRAGAVFLKFTHDYPTLQALADGRFVIDYIDELTRMAFQFEADWLVVDETTQPDLNLEALAQKLGIDGDGLGFAQSDNVRRMSNATNRRGVFVAGGSRGILSEDEQMADADQVSLNVLAFLQDLDAEVLPKVTIQRGRCVRCLTCHRLCPHLAIEIGPRISVVTEACQSCGICMASCPALAIEMEGVQIGAEVTRRMQQSRATADAPEKISPIMVFGCARSAGQALALTRLMGHTLPDGVQFIEVPCGGTIAARHLLAAFEAGADGVMLCTCHTDNCQSEIGNQVARKRADSVRDLLTAAGLEGDRLRIATLAANMGNEFFFIIKAFVDQIGTLND